MAKSTLSMTSIAYSHTNIHIDSNETKKKCVRTKENLCDKGRQEQLLITTYTKR